MAARINRERGKRCNPAASTARYRHCRRVSPLVDESQSLSLRDGKAERQIVGRTTNARVRRPALIDLEQTCEYRLLGFVKNRSRRCYLCVSAFFCGFFR